MIYTLLVLMHLANGQIEIDYMPNLSLDHCERLMHKLNTTANALSLCVEQKHKI